MTMVILSGGIDLSVGSTLALAGAVAAGLLKHGVTIAPLGVLVEFTVVGASIAAVTVGLTLGWCNGFVITRFAVPPFVATLGMLSIGRGLTFLWTGGYPITGLGEDFGFIGTGHFLGVPMPAWTAGALAVVFFGVTRRAIDNMNRREP
jgi:ribose transport system permease protein